MDRKEMLKTLIEKQEQFNQAKEEYDKIREVVLNYMKDLNLDSINLGGYSVVLNKRYKLDYDLLKEKYPDAYMLGMTYRFDDKKVKQLLSAEIVNKIRKNCSREVTEYVKIQKHIKGRKRGKVKRP